MKIIYIILKRVGETNLYLETDYAVTGLKGA